MRIQERNNGQKIITIPKHMAEAKGWEDKTEVKWLINNKGNLELTEPEE